MLPRPTKKFYDLPSNFSQALAERHMWLTAYTVPTTGTPIVLHCAVVLACASDRDSMATGGVERYHQQVPGFTFVAPRDEHH